MLERRNFKIDARPIITQRLIKFFAAAKLEDIKIFRCAG